MPKPGKLKAGELAETSQGQEVTVLAVNKTTADIQYTNNRYGRLPISELTPLGIMAAEPIRVSAFRIPPELKRAAAIRADREGVTLTSVIVEFLEKYAAGKRV
jgi:hypothetical protein